MFDADTRLSAIAFWQVLVFGLNATLFVLLGLQFEAVFDDARADVSTGELFVDVAIVSAVVIAIRLAWVGIAPLLARVIPAAGRADTGDDWRERLVVGWSGMRGAISLAAALAPSEQIEQRELLIFVTRARGAHQRGAPAPHARAVPRALPALHGGHGGDSGEARGEAAHDTIERYSALRRELIGVERDAILGLRNDGRLRQDTMRLIQRELDLEEARLPA